MDKTTVMVEFNLYGDNFDPDIITKALDLNPSETYLKGDKIKEGKNIRKDTAWSINTGYEESYDINDQLHKICILLKGKEEELVLLKKKYFLEILFMIVIKIENDEKPGIYLEKSFISLLNTIDAEVVFDIYFYS